MSFRMLHAKGVIAIAFFIAVFSCYYIVHQDNTSLSSKNSTQESALDLEIKQTIAKHIKHEIQGTNLIEDILDSMKTQLMSSQVRNEFLDFLKQEYLIQFRQDIVKDVIQELIKMRSMNASIMLNPGSMFNSQVEKKQIARNESQSLISHTYQHDESRQLSTSGPIQSDDIRNKTTFCERYGSTVETECNEPTSLSMKTLCWMKENDEISKKHSCDEDYDILRERYVIYLLYSSLKGSFMTPQDLTKSPTCDWQGITCDSNAIFVQNIEWSDRKLTGTLITELGLLERLEMLDLSDNSIEGTLAGDIEFSHEIVHFNISNNLFTGSIPSTIFASKQLNKFDASRNYFTESLPSSIGYSSSIKKIRLDQNKLSGSISADIFKANQIVELTLHSNKLTGTLPTEVGDLVNATILTLNSNTFKGEIPKQLENLKNLKYLHLHQNGFTGAAPDMNVSKSLQFITDCALPSYMLETIVTCRSCTICCNSAHFCQEQVHPFWTTLPIPLFAIVSVLIITIVLNFIGFILSKMYPYVRQMRYYRKDSVYCFLFAEDWTAWVIYAVTVAIQLSLFASFLHDASGSDVKFSSGAFPWKCAPSDLDCQQLTTKYIGPTAWVLLGVMALAYVGQDIAISCIQVREGWRDRKWGLFLGGIITLGVTILAVFTTIIYNLATVITKADLIQNSVILFFINELDEQIMTFFQITVSHWTEHQMRKIEKYTQVTKRHDSYKPLLEQYDGFIIDNGFGLLNDGIMSPNDEEIFVDKFPELAAVKELIDKDKKLIITYESKYYTSNENEKDEMEKKRNDEKKEKIEQWKKYVTRRLEGNLALEENSMLQVIPRPNWFHYDLDDILRNMEKENQTDVLKILLFTWKWDENIHVKKFVKSIAQNETVRKKFSKIQFLSRMNILDFQTYPDIIIAHGGEEILEIKEHNIYELSLLLDSKDNAYIQREKVIQSENIIKSKNDRIELSWLRLLFEKAPLICVEVSNSDDDAAQIARIFEARGGKCLYPKQSHLEESLNLMRLEKDCVAIISDSLSKHIKDAKNLGIDSVFIAGGIHAEELVLEFGVNAYSELLYQRKLTRLFDRYDIKPSHALRLLESKKQDKDKYYKKSLLLSKFVISVLRKAIDPSNEAKKYWSTLGKFEFPVYMEEKDENLLPSYSEDFKVMNTAVIETVKKNDEMLKFYDTNFRQTNTLVIRKIVKALDITITEDEIDEQVECTKCGCLNYKKFLKNIYNDPEDIMQEMEKEQKWMRVDGDFFIHYDIFITLGLKHEKILYDKIKREYSFQKILDHLNMKRLVEVLNGSVVDLKPKINLQNKTDGFTPLMLSIREYDKFTESPSIAPLKLETILKKMKNLGADISIKDNGNKTALHHAAKLNYLAAAEYILDPEGFNGLAKGILEWEDIDGHTPKDLWKL